MSASTVPAPAAADANGVLAPPGSKLILFVLLLTTLVTRGVGLLHYHPVDDAFITSRYARNLARGEGFVYNPGERVQGVTTPLFGAIQAGLLKVGLPAPLSAQVLNLLVDLGLLWFCANRFLRQGQPLTAVLFGLLFAVDPYLVRSSAGAMEMDLFVAVSLVTLALFVDGRTAWAAGLAAASCFLRPEGVILCGLLTLTMLLRWPRLARGQLLSFLATGFVVFIPPVILLWAIYGNPLPQSVMAKQTQSPTSITAILQAEFLYSTLHMALLPVVAWGVVVAWREKRWLGMVAIWGGLYVLAYIVGHPKLYDWYMYPVAMVKTVLAAAGAADLVARLPLAALRRVLTPGRIAIAGGVAVAAVYVALGIRSHDSPISRYYYGGMQSWFSEHPMQGKSILAVDIGALGWYSDCYIFDSYGLVSPQMLKIGGFSEQAEQVSPEYVFVGARQSPLQAWLDSPVSRRYRPVVRFSSANDPNLHPNPDDLTEFKWDGILYQRFE